jgi:hypothetical protein
MKIIKMVLKELASRNCNWWTRMVAFRRKQEFDVHSRTCIRKSIRRKGPHVGIGKKARDRRD